MLLNHLKISLVIKKDQMDIIHHSNYFTGFKLVKDHFIKALGISSKVIESRGLQVNVKKSDRHDVSLVIKDVKVFIRVKIKAYKMSKF